MPTLGNFLGAIMSSIAEAQNISDKYSAQLAQKYDPRDPNYPHLDVFSIPNAQFSKVDVQLRFAITKLDDRLLDLAPALVQDALLSLLKYLKNKQQAAPSGNPWYKFWGSTPPEPSPDQLRALEAILEKESFREQITLALMDYLRMYKGTLFNDQFQVQTDSLTKLADLWMNQRVLKSPELASYHLSLDSDNLKALIQQWQKIIDMLPQKSTTSLATAANNSDVEIIVDENLIRNMPESSISTINLQINVDDLPTSKFTMDDQAKYTDT